jgi:hypothetical protein
MNALTHRCLLVCLVSVTTVSAGMATDVSSTGTDGRPAVPVEIVNQPTVHLGSGTQPYVAMDKCTISPGGSLCRLFFDYPANKHLVIQYVTGYLEFPEGHTPHLFFEPVLPDEFFPFVTHPRVQFTQDPFDTDRHRFERNVLVHSFSRDTDQTLDLTLLISPATGEAELAAIVYGYLLDP